MNNELVRKIVGVVVGLIVAGIVIGMIETLSVRYLFPEAIAAMDPKNPSAMDAPILALVMVCVAQALGVWAGITTSFAISKGWRFSAVIIGALFLLGALANFFMIPHPLWFLPASLAAIIIGIAIPIRRLKD